MEERDLSAKAKEAWIRREEHSQETVLAMLRKLEGGGRGKETAGVLRGEKVPLKTAMKKENLGGEDGGGGGGGVVVRRRMSGGMDVGGVELRRNRRMGKFVEHLPSEEEVEEMEKDVVSTTEETKADWRLSRMGPKVLSYEPAPWEEEEQHQQQATGMNQLIPSAMDCDSQGLEDIVEDEEDSESQRTQYTDLKPKMLTPPAEYSHPSPTSSHGGYFPIYKLPSDIFPAPPTPRSP